MDEVARLAFFWYTHNSGVITEMRRRSKWLPDFGLAPVHKRLMKREGKAHILKRITYTEHVLKRRRNRPSASIYPSCMGKDKKRANFTVSTYCRLAK